MGGAGFLYKSFLDNMGLEPTPSQDRMLRSMADFLTTDDGDIMVVNGYAGTGKTTAVASIVRTLLSLEFKCELMAPTGRAAKVLSSYCQRPAHTVHKVIYRQKSVGSDGFGQFNLMPNKSKDTLFIVDEVSLIGIEEGLQGRSQSSFGSGNLLSDLVEYVRNGSDCRLLLIGDSAQLPPVGLDCSPALSSDYMSVFGGVSFSVLTDVVRQGRDSGILFNATGLRGRIENAVGTGEICSDLKLSLDGFPDIERIGGGELIEKITESYERYGDDETVILCRSNKRAIRYNLGIRSTVLFKEERLTRGDKLMIVKNCYQFVNGLENMDYIANGDIAKLISIRNYEDRYGLHFADARLMFPDYGEQETVAKVCLDTLESESAALTYEQQNMLYQGVDADYGHISSKRKRYEAVREDPFYNALQLKYANAVTCHKSQGGQWKCVFIDCPFWQDGQTLDDLKWLYTAITRATEKVYLVNFDKRFFE